MVWHIYCAQFLFLWSRYSSCNRVQPEAGHSRKNLSEKGQPLSSPWHEALRAEQHEVFAELLPMLGVRPLWKQRAVVSISARATLPVNASLKEITAIKTERKKSSTGMAAAWCELSCGWLQERKPGSNTMDTQPADVRSCISHLTVRTRDVLLQHLTHIFMEENVWGLGKAEFLGLKW